MNESSGTGQRTTAGALLVRGGVGGIGCGPRNHGNGGFGGGGGGCLTGGGGGGDAFGIQNRCNWDVIGCNCSIFLYNVCYVLVLSLLSNICPTFNIIIGFINDCI